LPADCEAQQQLPISLRTILGTGVLLFLAETAAVSWRLQSWWQTAATGNARSPMVERRVGGACNIVLSVERRRRRA